LFNDSASSDIYTLSLHDALPIFCTIVAGGMQAYVVATEFGHVLLRIDRPAIGQIGKHERIREYSNASVLGHFSCHGRFHIETERSEEHTSELQSRENLVCRLLLE